jgi:hypothetical protein
MDTSPDQADTVYDHTQPWSSQFLRTGPRFSPEQDLKIQQALWAADPNTPADNLRGHAPFNVIAISPTAGQPTLNDVLSKAAGTPPQQSIFNYSDTEAGVEASSRNHIEY